MHIHDTSGMMNEIPLQTKKGFVDLVFGIYENDVKVVCDALDEVRISTYTLNH
jgi:hypothetical protein